MKVGVKRFTYARYKSGGNGSAIVYENGVMTTDKTVRVEYSTKRDDGSFSADDHIIDRDNSVIGVTATVELATLTKAMAADILGWQKVGNTDEYEETEDESPYIGCGWAFLVKEDGEKKYRGVWIYKIQMGQESDAATTKGERVEYQTESITGSGMGVQLTAGGKIVFRAVMFDCADLSTAETWLKSKAGIQS